MARWWQAAARLPWGLLLVAVGVVLLVLGWYGVSGQPTVAQQLPYFASATVPGAVLVIAGAIVVGSGIVRDGRGACQGGHVEQMVAELHATLLEAAAESPTRVVSAAVPAADMRDDGGLVAVVGGRLVHRSTCALVAGKATAQPITSRDVADRGLQRCPVCDPDVAVGPAAEPSDG